MQHIKFTAWNKRKIWKPKPFLNWSPRPHLGAME